MLIEGWDEAGFVCKIDKAAQRKIRRIGNKRGTGRGAGRKPWRILTGQRGKLADQQGRDLGSRAITWWGGGKGRDEGEVSKGRVQVVTYAPKSNGKVAEESRGGGGGSLRRGREGTG